MTLCYLGLGSNLRSPERQLRQALHKISKLSRTIILKRSKLYFNKSQGLKAQPHYCNMVLAINSSFTPQHLLTKEYAKSAGGHAP